MKRFLYTSYFRSAGLTHRWRRMLTPAGWFVLAAFFICSALGMDTDQTMAYQAVAVFGAILIMAAAFSASPPPPVELRRDLPRYASVGTPFHYRAQLKHTRKQPLRGLSLLENTGDPRPTRQQFLQTPEPGEEKRNLFDRIFVYYRWTWLMTQNHRAQRRESELPTLPAGREAEVNLQLTPLRRGILRLEGAEIVGRDPFGLTRRYRIAKAPAQSVLVLPKRYPVPSMALPGTFEYQQGGVALASSVGESEEFVSLREYRQGDPLRHIHWKSTARTGELVVKEYQDEFFVRHAMVLDTFQREQPPEVFEEAVSVAASFACTLRKEDSLLDLLFVGPKAYCFTAGRGVGHTEQLLEVLAAVEPCREESFDTLEQLVFGHSSEVSGILCIFLAWDEARQEFVRRLQARNVPLLVLVIAGAGHSQDLDPGPMRADPAHFHVLNPGQIEQALLKLK